MSTQFARLGAVAVAAMLLLAGCGDDDTGSPGTTTDAATTTTPAGELARAREAVTSFLDALSRGDIAAAASRVGPVSEQRAQAAGGLQSLLRQSTEGHGAWPAARGKTVTALGIEPGLAVVVLEGTLSVEGSTEHRVAAFPVRKAESANVWFVEPWAYALQGGPPLRILSPSVDEGEWATAPNQGSVSVVVEAPASGTVTALVESGHRSTKPVPANGRVSFQIDHRPPMVVTLVHQDGPTVSASSFRVRS